MIGPKDFDDSMREAAHAAAEASKNAMREMRKRNAYDEDDVTGVLLGELNAALRGRVGGFKWEAKILRHRKGKAAEEQAMGADILLEIKTKGIGRDYKKGVLIQSKKVERGSELSSGELARLQDQCETMLSHSPSSYVFDYSTTGVRCSSANKIRNTASGELYENCEMTAFRFFFDFFRCTIGDRKVNTKLVDSVMARIAKTTKSKGVAPAVLSLTVSEG
jgi:hypothetical protein